MMARRLIQNDRLWRPAVCCRFPTIRVLPKFWDAPPRSGGLSEFTDAWIIVVSEETGVLSLARGGPLEREFTVEDLRQQLRELYESRAEKTKSSWGIPCMIGKNNWEFKLPGAGHGDPRLDFRQAAGCRMSETRRSFLEPTGFAGSRESSRCKNPSCASSERRRRRIYRQEIRDRKPIFFLGRDTRQSGPWIASAFAEGAALEGRSGVGSRRHLHAFVGLSGSQATDDGRRHDFRLAQSRGI